MQDTTDNQESQDTYPNAGRASGYTDERGNDVGENIINRVTELMVGPQTKMIQLSARLDAAHTLQDQRFSYILNQLDAFLTKEDTRHEAYDALLQQSEASSLAALTGIALRLDQITGYVQQGVTIARKSQATARQALAVSKETGLGLKKVQAELGVLAAQVAGLDEELAELKAWKDAQAGGN